MNKIISIILALTLMISSSPMDLSSANTASNDIVIDNSAISNDNELVTNGTGSNASDAIELSVVNSFDLAKAYSNYFQFTAPKDGKLSVTIATSTGKWYYMVGSSGKWDTQPEDVEMKSGDKYLINIRIYTDSSDKYGGAAGTATFTVNFTSAGGETPDPEPSCEHKNTELRDKVDATCSEPGYTGDTWCKDCNTKIADGETTSATGNHVNAAGKWEYDDTNHWQICDSCTGKFNENAHTEGNEWLTDDTGHWKLCATCQKALTKTSHNYVEGVCICGAKDPDYCDHVMSAYELTDDPTCTGNGIEVSTCTKCKSFVKTRFVMPLGHNYVDGKCTDCDATESTVGKSTNPKEFAVGDQTVVSSTTATDKYFYFVFYAIVDGTVSVYSEGTDWRANITIYNADGTIKEPGNLYNPANGSTITRELTAGQKLILKITNYANRMAVGGEITVNFQFAPNCTHGFVEDGTPATCEAPGRVGYTCATCNISYAEYTRALGHDMGEYIQTKAPTCTEKGEETSYCSRCDHKEYRDVAENGHTMGDYTQTKAPSCTAPGEKTATCSACGHTETQVIPANGHSSSNYIQTKAPTCTDPGEETATCSVCGQTDTRPIAALGHDTVTVAHKDATCTEDGVVGGRYCARCEAGKADAVNEIIPATGHTYVDGKCSCGAKDPNYVPEGTEGNPKLLTEEGHTFVLERYSSNYFFAYTAKKECSGTIMVTGSKYQILIHRYDLEDNKIGEEMYKCTTETSSSYVVALEAGEKILVKFVPNGMNLTITASIQTADCDHVYDINCEDANCNECSGTRIAPGHNWENKDGICASCGFVCQHGEYDDGFCTICGKECDHNWTDATCTTPKTCSECQLIDGEALGHDWSNKDGICVTCKCECQHGELTAVCPICGKAPEIKAVAQINGTQYASLQEAIAAATDGDTIVLLSDLELTHADAHVFEHETANQYKVMFAVAGKDITIDLNGKTISVTATPASLDDPTTGFGRGTIIASKVEGEGMIDWKADQVKGMLMAVIAVYDKGHLTLKDTAGTGGIQTTAYSGSGTSCGIVYSVLTNYSTDSSITIEAGKYEADFTKDSLVYTYASANEGIGNVGVVVKGGTFILGNAGEGRNGSTWIFNAKGQNERHVWITGGSFNTDIRHQYWIFEAQVSGDCALVKNGEMYTIVSAKYTVNEQYKSGKWYTYEMGYTTLAEAVAAAEANAENAAAAQKTLTITMLDNDTGAGAEVNGFNLIIDFNGRTYTLTSGGFQVTEGNTLTLKNGTLQVAEGAKIGQGVDASEAKVQYMP